MWLANLEGPPRPMILKQEFGRIYDMQKRVDHLNQALEALMTSLVVSAWAGFETLAGDLWEAALNTHPARLARLTGTSKRIGELAGEKSRGIDADTPQEDELDVPPADARGILVHMNDIEVLTQGSYNLSGKMGSLLRSRFKFATLKGIRAAYSEAFTKKEKKARTTNEYVEKAKNAPMAPLLNEGEKLELGGKLCRSLVEATVTPSVELIKAVDSWLTLTA
jgi:hypothetical protein